jgi:predicted MFS family arabinose efflux permease
MAESRPREHDANLRSAWSLLRRNRDFRKLYVASIISFGGDWFLFVALGGLILQVTGTATSVAFLIVSQELPIFLVTPWAGWVVDRFNRKRVMIVCDVARVAICVTFLLVGPENLWLAYLLIASLSIFTAVFDPASSAATPNLVDASDLGVANAMNGSVWGTMLAVGAALGGVIATIFGRDTAFLVDAASFAASALLLSGIRRRFSEDREHEEHVGVVSATVETARYAREDHRVLALLSVKFGFGLAAGVLALIAVFAREVFHGGDIGFGLLMASRGVGALVGPFLGHRIAGKDRERLLPAIALALGVFGLGYLALGLMPTLGLAAVAILVAHLGGGAQWMLSTYGLQRLVPDRIRGRIFAFDYAFITLSLAISSLVAGSLSDALGPREAVMIVGGIALAWAAVWWLLTKNVRRTPIFDREPTSDEAVASTPIAVD